MANFAIAADENVIARGNKLIEELQEPGEKKGVTLNRLFDLVRREVAEEDHRVPHHHPERAADEGTLAADRNEEAEDPREELREAP